MEATRLKVKVWRMMKGFARCFAALSLLWATNLAVASGDVSDKRACQEGRPHCTHFVIQGNGSAVSSSCERLDHDAIFSLLYLRTTEKFRETLNAIGYSDPASIIRQDGIFADFYFRAYDAYHKVKELFRPHGRSHSRPPISAM